MKCEHTICDCVISESMDFCSIHCLEETERADDTAPHTVCQCGHPDCRGTSEDEAPAIEEPERA